MYDKNLAPALQEYLTELGVINIPISTAIQGKIDLDILHAQSKYHQLKIENVHSHAHSALNHSQGITAPAIGSIKVANKGEGYYSYGWICAPAKVFNYRCVIDTLISLSIERLKGVIITEQGVLACNLSDGCLSLNILGLEEAADSRLEFITQDKILAEQTCRIFESVFDLTSI